MLVSFDPYINTGADQTGQYLNFLRCVTAIATAAAGTTSLTVNPWVSSGTTDATKNCITEIISNTTAGGWTVNTTNHNIPATNSYTAMTSLSGTFAQQYKADFYNSSGKAAMPYNKMCFHTDAHNTNGYDQTWNGYLGGAPISNWSNNSYGGQIMMTYGCSTTTDFTDANFVPNNGSFNSVQPNQQTQSWTNNAYHSSNNADQTPYTRSGFNQFLNPAVTYTMSVTSEYCIIWETVRGASYATGYSNSYTNSTYNSYGAISPMYGSLMYGGNRTTQAWEDSLGYNPPWVAFVVHHTSSASGSGGYDAQRPLPPNSAAAYMATINDSGTISATASRVTNWPVRQYQNYSGPVHLQCPISSVGFSGPFGSSDNNDRQYMNTQAGQVVATGFNLATPIFSHRQRPFQNSSYNITNWNANMPTVDPVTGLFVPGAYPVQFSKYLTNAWNPGGYAKGIYKSLTMPLATMKLYYAPGQVFNINGTPYTPVIFNEDMYLIAAT